MFFSVSNRKLVYKLRLARLAPDIIEDIARGLQPVGVSLEFFMRNPLHDDWDERRRIIAEPAFRWRVIQQLSLRLIEQAMPYSFSLSLAYWLPRSEW